MKNKNFLIIINPISGKKKHKQDIIFVENFFNKHSIKIIKFYTEYKGHANEYLKKVNDKKFTDILVYGGDGTFNEVVNGVLGRKDKYNPNIGFLPGGSGNAVIHHLNLLDIEKACENILRSNLRIIDVMELSFNDSIEYSINIVGWGMVTDIGILSEKLRWFGPARYTIASLIYIFNIKNRFATIKINDAEYQDDYLFILISNTKYTGKGMKIAPHAKLNDQKLDLICVKNNITKFNLIKLLPKLFTGEHIQSKYVDYVQIQSLEILPKYNDALNIDGEIHGFTPIQIRISDKRLSIYSD